MESSGGGYIQMKKYNLKEFPKPLLLHDAIIDNIYIINNELNICVHNVFFWKKDINNSKCIMKFSGFEDILFDIQVYIYNIDNKLNINGKNYYFQDFLNFINDREFHIEVIDVAYTSGYIAIIGYIHIHDTKAQIILVIYCDDFVILNA